MLTSLLDSKSEKVSHISKQISQKHMHTWGQVILHQSVSSRVQHVNKNWMQLDLSFCENERSKRSKINDKWGQLD